MGACATRCGCCIDGCRAGVRLGLQSGDGIKQLEPVTDRGDAKLLQSLMREAREKRLVYLILAECRLIPSEAQAPQPDHNVHDGGTHTSPRAPLQEMPRGSLVTAQAH